VKFNLRKATPLLSLLASATLSCVITPPFEELILYPEAYRYSERSGDCDIQLEWEESLLPERCVAIGDVFVGEKGGTLGCGKEAMVALTREVACQSRADFGVMSRVRDWNSSCVNIRTRLYVCHSVPIRSDSGRGSDR